MNWMILPLKRYADFSGRSRRKEYWMFILFYLLVAAALGIVGAMIADGAGTALFLLLGVYFLVMFIPSLAVQVRRFHDQDKSGWWVLLGLLPYIGGPLMIGFMCVRGTNGPNRFGPDPVDPLGHYSDVFR